MRKLKLLLTATALLLGGGISAWAQTDVTSTYLTNADFSSTDGWTQYVSGGFKDFGNGLIGTYGVRTAEGQANSTVDETHLATEYCFGFEARWSGNYASFNQTTSDLKVGEYTLTFDVENTNSKTTKASYDNLFYVQVGGTKYTDSSTEWMNANSSWTTHTISFKLVAASTATVSLGYGTGSNNIGSTNTPTLHVSHLKLVYKEIVVKDVLETALTAATAANATLNSSDLASAIATAQAVYNSEVATQDEVNNAAADLNAATALAMSAAGDVTAVLLSNPGFESCTVTTTNAAAGGSAAPLDIAGNWIQVSSASWSSSAVVAYGGDGQVNGVKAPSADNAGKDGNALGVSVGWGGTVTYQSAAVTLPAGAYTLKVNAYNAHTKTQFSSKFGFVPTSGTSKISPKNSFTSNTWETDIVTFTLDEATEGKIQIGGQAISGGSGDNAKVFFDNITINYQAIVRPTAISLSVSSLNLKTCGTATLTPVYSPNGANTDIDITWTTSDATVATVSAGVVTAVGPGTATITAKLTKDESKTATCNVTVTDVDAVSAPSSYSEIAAGDFYIVNAATGKYLGGANSWGTQASLIEHGIPFGVTVGEDVYTLDTYTYEADNKHFLSGTYVDGESTNLYIKPLGDGKYSISTADGSSFLTANTNNTVVENTAPTANSVLAQWYFLSREDMLKSLTAATEVNPSDATFFLTEANISRNLRKSRNNSGWKGSFSYGGNNENQCAESINKKHDVYQTVSVPNGNYIVKVQGFYRPGESAVASYLYANDESTALKVINANSEGTAENMGGASTAFSAGQYQNQLEVTVTDNKLTVGVKTDAEDSWTIWDNFELYLKNAEGLNVSPVIANGDYYLTPDNGVTYLYRGLDSGTQGTLDASNNLYATVSTDIAGISTITFKDTNKRMFWNEEMIYTDGLRHVNKNTHHPFWAIEANDGSYKLRNIETGLYLAADAGVATATAEGSSWKFDIPASNYSDLKTAIATAEAKTLGFENGEYAPYNNIIPLNSLALAKTIDESASNPTLKIGYLVDKLTNNWRANNSEVNAFYDGDFAIQNENTTGPTALMGWSNPQGIRQLIKDTETYPGLTSSSAKAAVFAWGNTTMSYGDTEGYTMPLGAHTIYELSFKTCGWKDGDLGYVNVDIKNESSEGLQTVGTVTATKRITDENPWDESKFYFETGDAGKYKFGMWTSKHTTFTDLVLKKAVAEEVNVSEDATAAPAHNYANVTLTRTLSKDYWNTFSVPFDAAIPEGWTVKEFDNAIDNVITFKDATTIVAGKPYLVKPNANVENPIYYNVIVKSTEGTTDGTGDYKFAAQIYNKDLATDGTIAYLATDGKIKKLNTASGLKGLRAYFIIPAGATEARIAFLDGETTGISRIENSELRIENSVYNLQGQRVNKAQKGLYIKNGKKVVMK